METKSEKEREFYVCHKKKLISRESKVSPIMSLYDVSVHEAGLTEMKHFDKAFRNAYISPPWQTSKITHHQRWNPYTIEGGSTLAIAGENFAIVATDTRMSQHEVNIMNREAEKVHDLNKSIILATAGFYGDVLQLRRVLQARLHKYRFDYRADMTVDLCAELLSRNLYYRRFFPYYTGAVLAGKGAVYSYDPIGCIERLAYSSSGAGESMIQPFLDNQVGHFTLGEKADRPKLTIERAIGLAKDAFKMTAEREISTGDSIRVHIAEAGKPIRKEFVKLRED
uniref:Proteasome subunit beta n=2 Tax=Panagrolaimus sp. PS1159 TaxID=55785 RepID=A0AC35EYA2_9BILA